ncbi:MAG: hypothetical protein UC708_02975 [Anaerovoracaceae bacterium]|nr:hypothetical protein [Bacillota bacterium]MEE0516825.1 hypothetical protein [Anaerovoracaceae bacterium]
MSFGSNAEQTLSIDIEKMVAFYGDEKAFRRFISVAPAKAMKLYHGVRIKNIEQ